MMRSFRVLAVFLSLFLLPMLLLGLGGGLSPGQAAGRLAPAANLVASIPKTIQKAPGPDANLAWLPMLPYQAPAGRWTIQIEGPTGRIQGSFVHPPDGQDYSLNRSVGPGSA